MPIPVPIGKFLQKTGLQPHFPNFLLPSLLKSLTILLPKIPKPQNPKFYTQMEGSSSSHPQNSKLRLPSLEFEGIPTPRSNMFRLNPHYQTHGRSTKVRKVVKEMHIESNLLRGTLLYDMLRFQNIEKLVSKDLIVYKDMVKWFYQYAKIEFYDDVPNPHMTISLFAHPDFRLTYTSEDFEEDFGLKYEGVVVDEIKVWPDHFEDLDDTVIRSQVLTARVLNQQLPNCDSRENVANINLMNGDDLLMDKLIRKCIMPTENKDAKCTKRRTLLLYLIKTFVKVNWMKMIGKYMIESCQNRLTKTIPYGGLVTFIMAKWRIKVAPERLPDSTIINRTYLTTNGIYLVGAHFVRDKDRDNLEEDIRNALDEEIRRCDALRRCPIIESEEEEEEAPLEGSPVGQRVTIETIHQQNEELREQYNRDMKKLKKASKWHTKALKKILSTTKMACSSASSDSD